MGIVEYEQENTTQPVESLAQLMYNKQVADISSISDTNWYKEIKRYWTDVLKSSEQELKIIKPEFLHITQERVRIAESFLSFLENLEKATIINEI